MSPGLATRPQDAGAVPEAARPVGLDMPPGIAEASGGRLVVGLVRGRGGAVTLGRGHGRPAETWRRHGGPAQATGVTGPGGGGGLRQAESVGK